MEHKKVVLITGCSSGIGYYTALTFARNGYTTFATVRNMQSEGAKSLTTIAEQEKLNLQTIALDVTHPTSIKKAVETVEKQAGRIDILMNNAGVMYLGPVELFTIDEIKTQFETNFLGALRMIKEVVPIMRRQKSGLIINVSSINGLVSFPLYGIYSSSKFALETATEVLKLELAPFSINVMLIEPGVFSSNLWKKSTLASGINQKDSPYLKLTSFLKRIDQKLEEKHTTLAIWLTHPQRVADTIYKKSQQENPKLRNIVGFDARLLYTLRKLVPERLWFWGLHTAYKW